MPRAPGYGARSSPPRSTRRLPTENKRKTVWRQDSWISCWLLLFGPYCPSFGFWPTTNDQRPTTVLLLFVPRGLRPALQRLPVPDGAFAAVICQLKVLRQLQRVRRAGIFAQPAEHAPAQ